MGDTAPAPLTIPQRDRAAGVLLGLAAGDALAAPDPGVWGAQTASAIAVAEFAAAGADLADSDIGDRIAARWNWWADTVGDLDALNPVPAAAIALAHLADPTTLARAAEALSARSGVEPAAGQAGLLWAAAIRHAVLTGTLDARIGLEHLDEDQRRLWLARFAEAESTAPAALTATGPIGSVQRAWSAITRTAIPVDDPIAGVFSVDHLRLVLEAAPLDAAAPAGALLGAAYGASAVPACWRLRLRGWPGLRSRDLIGLANAITGIDDAEGSHRAALDDPPPRRHPHDDAVFIGGVGCLARPSQYVPAGVDAIVSLCTIPDTYLRTDAVHLDVRMTESGGPNPDFVLRDTVRAIGELRAAGRTVLLHGLRGRARTATVAAAYGARRAGIGVDAALRDVCAVLPDADPGGDLRAALHRLGGAA